MQAWRDRSAEYATDAVASSAGRSSEFVAMREDGRMTDEDHDKGHRGAEDSAPEQGRTVVVVGPDGAPIGTMEVGADDTDAHEDPSRLVEQPAKVMRIGSMIKQLLEEVR